MEVGREQALAFRLAAHNLHRRLPAGRPRQAAAVIGLQDFPPGLAPVALAARVEDARPEDIDELVIVHAFRGASIAVPRADLAVFTIGARPAGRGGRAGAGRDPPPTRSTRRASARSTRSTA